jgi:hypothetical protein
VDGPARITLQSELTAKKQLPPAGADPLVAAALDPLRGKYHDATGTAVVLVHKTRRSGLRPGAALDHVVDCPAPVRAESRSLADGGLVTATTVLAPGSEAAGDQVRGLKSLGTQAPGFGRCLRAIQIGSAIEPVPRARAQVTADGRPGAGPGLL